MVMFAGDPSHKALVLTEFDSLLGKNKQLAGVPTENDVLIRNTLCEAFREVLKRKIESEILSPIGLTREKFLKEGKDMLGDHEFSSILNQIKDAKLETDFLVAGFGADGVPRIFTVGDPGTEYVHDAMAYHAIGCGAFLADAALMASFDPLAPLPDIIYRVLEAKFLSEAAPGVGKSTFVNTLDQQGKIQCIFSTETEKMRKLWESNKRPVPARAKETIKKILTDEHPFRV